MLSLSADKAARDLELKVVHHIDAGGSSGCVDALPNCPGWPEAYIRAASATGFWIVHVCMTETRSRHRKGRAAQHSAGTGEEGLLLEKQEKNWGA